SSLQLAVTMSLLGLLPAFVMLTTSYVRISVVLAVLRQALGGQQLLPAQVSMSLAMFCTALIMWPTWTNIHQNVVEPWQAGQTVGDWTVVSAQALQPVREFMVKQIDTHQNWDDVHLFMKYANTTQYPATFDEVPMRVLFPAYLLSELKTAFLIGFQIYLPFLVIDLVVAAVTTSMGMFMLAPTTVALPLKMLLFVLVDGWRLVIDMLMQSFQ
ncbi:MAG: flagellar type III secretion system pore protein FliP, partial [Planctomycetales bacterium]|nr:flagellar type III secretion system pore protein FliP [Planctomycetales bacterium]